VEARRADTTVEAAIEAYLPDSYITKPAQKVEMYRRIAGIRSQADRDDVIEEMIDRYGDPPKAAMNLVGIAYFKSLASAIGIGSILQRGSEWVLRFQADARVDLPKLVESLQNNAQQATFIAGEVPMLIFKGDNGMERAQRFLERLQ
jgi:transcription-repair coupling factor (superfamily II helicase)